MKLKVGILITVDEQRRPIMVHFDIKDHFVIRHHQWTATISNGREITH